MIHWLTKDFIILRRNLRKTMDKIKVMVSKDKIAVLWLQKMEISPISKRMNEFKETIIKDVLRWL